MKKVRVLTAEEAALLVNDGDTIATGGFVSCACPEALSKALEKRFLETGPDIKTDIKKEGSNFVGTVRLSADSQISFFNRIKVFDRETGKRILPVHYSDNYITLMPGDQQEISLEFPANLPEERIQIVVDSYNSPLP